MLASRHFGVTRKKSDDWFDPILSADTQVFVDPFLIFKDADDKWASCHNTFIDHFEFVFELVAKSNGNRKSLHYKKAVDLLTCREPREFCLGYASDSTDGAGTGKGKARMMAKAIENAIERGLKNPQHFEEVGILNKYIGPDLISDIALTILKPVFVDYTHEISKRHKLPQEAHRVYAAEFDDDLKRFESPEIDLPTNPYSGHGVMFVPARFLRRLPTLNADDWYQWYAEQTVADLDRAIIGKVNKTKIIQIAQKNVDAVRKWVDAREDQPSRPYDLRRDAEGWYRWSEAGWDYAQGNPQNLKQPKNETEFLALVETMIDQFQRFVEERGGHELLWNGSRPKRESAAQLLFRGIVDAYCEANDLSIEREVDVGTGKIDIKITQGFSKRVLIEIKKLEANSFADRIQNQLPTYMSSEKAKDGWYLVLQFRDEDESKKRKAAFPGMISKVSKDEKLNIRGRIVSAIPPIPASKRMGKSSK